MKINTYLKNNCICLFTKNKHCIKLSYFKLTISLIKEPHFMQNRYDLGIAHNQGVQIVMKRSLCSKCKHVTAICFNQSTHNHPRYFNNINKVTPVESFVGSSTGILSS